MNTPFSLSEVISLLAPECASNLASQIEALVEESEAIAASLIAFMSALPLASREKRGWALWRAEVVLQSETTWASVEAETRAPLASHEAEMDFSSQIALEADLASYTVYRCWREATLTSVKTELDPQMTFFISSGTCFRAVVRGDQATEIFLCLHALMGFETPSLRICSNLP